MLKKLERLSGEVLEKNPFWQYKQDTYRLPNGEVRDYYFVATNGSVFIIAKTNDGQIILLNQFRYLNQRESLEFPGGGLGDGADTLVQAKRELQEEAGLEAASWSYLGGFNPMNGVTNEICHVFLATNLHEISASPEATEEFEKMIFTENEIDALIASNKIWDGMTLAAWALYKSA